jgi:hypothetical protein
VFRRFECVLPSDRYELYFSVFDRASQAIISEEFQVLLQVADAHEHDGDPSMVDSDEERDVVQLSEIGHDLVAPAFASSHITASPATATATASTTSSSSPTETASTPVTAASACALTSDMMPSEAKKIALFTDLSCVEWKQDVVLVCRVLACERHLGSTPSNLASSADLERHAIGFGVAPLRSLLRPQKRGRWGWWLLVLLCPWWYCCLVLCCFDRFPFSLLRSVCCLCVCVCVCVCCICYCVCVCVWFP